MEGHGLIFNLKELDKLHEEYKEKKENSVEDIKKQQVSFLLEKFNEVDLDACKRAYEDLYVQKGSFNSDEKPNVCVSKEIIFPNTAALYLGTWHLDEALKKLHKGLTLDNNFGFFDDGPRIIVEPSFFEFDMNVLNSRRAAILNKEREDEDAVIRRAVPELIDKLSKLHLDKCYESYRKSYIKKGEFRCDANCFCSVKLEVKVNQDDFQKAFFSMWRERKKDNRVIGLSFSSMSDCYLVTATISATTFLK